MSILIKNGTIVTMNENRDIISGSILLEGNKIKAIGDVQEPADRIIDATGKVVIPGLIQTHVHYVRPFLGGKGMIWNYWTG